MNRVPESYGEQKKPEIRRNISRSKRLRARSHESLDDTGSTTNLNLLSSINDPVSYQNSSSNLLKGWVEGITIPKSSAHTAINDAGDGFARTLYSHVFKMFNHLFPYLVGQPLQPTKGFDRVLKKTLGNLFLWGDSLRDGQLEVVLEESDDIKGSVLESLSSIGNILISTFSLLFHESGLIFNLELLPTCSKAIPEALLNSISQDFQELTVLLEKAKMVVDSECESDESTSSVFSAKNKTLNEMSKSLKSAVKCLMDLLPSMEATLASTKLPDLDNQASTPVEFKTSAPAQTYILNVYDRFSKADWKLIERLGEANWQRHTALRSISEPMEQEPPKSAFVPVSLFHDSGLGSSVPANSSYAATIASHSSFVTSLADNENSGLRVPSTPKAVFEGKSFRCQICNRTLDHIKNRIDWKYVSFTCSFMCFTKFSRRHVFADIKPYICTFSGCADELKAFPTRKLWEDHEFSLHRQSKFWACTQCPNKSQTTEDFRSHLINEHHIKFSRTQFQRVSQIAERSEQQAMDKQECPLCLEVPGKSKRHFITHVGKHMESIALASLPRDCAPDSETSSVDSNDRHSTIITENPSKLQLVNLAASNKSEGKKENSFTGATPDLEEKNEDEREYEFETLLDRRQKRDGNGELVYNNKGDVLIQYRIKWVGDQWDPTWEDEENIPLKARNEYAKRDTKNKKQGKQHRIRPKPHKPETMPQILKENPLPTTDFQGLNSGTPPENPSDFGQDPEDSLSRMGVCTALDDDSTLMLAHVAGMNWEPIQTMDFPNKTANEIHRRQESLMDKKIHSDELPELEDIGESPEEFLSRRTGKLAMPIPYSNDNTYGVSTKYSDPQDAPAVGTALTDAMTLVGGMSRQNSLYNEAFPGSVPVTKSDSPIYYSRPSQEQWDDIKPLIQQLYVNDGHTMVDVVNLLKEKYGFDIT